MEVNEDMKLAFVHIPKTGGMSISEALNLKGVRHFPSSYYKENYPDYIRFTVIRGWKDRLVSSQKYHETNKHRIKHYEKSLYEQHLPIDFYLDYPCHYYLRFERLQEDFSNMLNELGYNDIKLPRLNESKD